jgi:hypothetical protein
MSVVSSVIFFEAVTLLVSSTDVASLVSTSLFASESFVESLMYVASFDSVGLSGKVAVAFLFSVSEAVSSVERVSFGSVFDGAFSAGAISLLSVSLLISSLVLVFENASSAGATSLVSASLPISFSEVVAVRSLLSVSGDVSSVEVTSLVSLS